MFSNAYEHFFSSGKIVKDSKYFQSDGSVWPEGYTAVRKFSSLTGGYLNFCNYFCFADISSLAFDRDDF